AYGSIICQVRQISTYITVLNSFLCLLTLDVLYQKMDHLIECGFGYGAGARCAPCRPGRYKEEAGGQKCKPCLSCAHNSRLHRANCTTTGNAVCGDCLPG
uniref:TNFR-Cys domain-containing protein n=1 Tax=Salmo trutta TaxID=8032 RepID=A0A674BKK5_SALTR